MDGLRCLRRIAGALAVAVAGAALTAASAQAQTLLAYYNVNQSSAGPLTDLAGTINLSEGAGSSGLLYQQSTVTNGTYGALTVSGSPFGSAVALGANGWSSSAGTNVLNQLTNNYTVMAWINPTALTGSSANNRVLAVSGSWGFGTSQTNIVFTKFGVADAFSSGGLAAGSWQHIAVTVSSTAGISFYVNGTAMGTSANTAATNASGNAVFLGSVAGGEDFAGLMDEVRVYSGVLSVGQIQSAAVTAIPEPGAGVVVFAVIALGVALVRSRRSRLVE